MYPYRPPPPFLPPQSGQLPPPPGPPHALYHHGGPVPGPGPAYLPPPPPAPANLNFSYAHPHYRPQPIPRPLPPGFRHVPAPPPPAPSSFSSVTPITFAPLPPPLPPPPSPPPPPPSSPPPAPPGSFDGDLDCPPKPADGEVVRNIEVLCDYIVKVGPHFEELARAKEARNPKFAFLFGGESGSDAAVGKTYFEWMKKKCISDADLPKEKDHNDGTPASPAGSDMDMEDDKGTDYMEDVSPVRASPKAVECGTEKIAQGLSGDSSVVSVAQTLTGGRTKDVKDGSPIRLVLAYDSDSSEENDQKESDKHINTAMVPSSSAAGVSGLQRDKGSEPLSSFSPKNVSAEESISDLPSVSQCSASSPQKGQAPSAICHNAAELRSDVYGHDIITQVDKKCDDETGKTDSPLNKNISNSNHHDGKNDSAKVDVDEFGRLVRADVSDSETDETRYIERRNKRGRSRSRSPQGSRRRRRSRSPRRRDNRSRSRSLSPQRKRSRSPPGSRQTNVFTRRDRDQRPCFNFKRGRCSRGASCKFLHRDFTQHESKQQQHKEVFEPNRTAKVEMDEETCADAHLEEAKHEVMKLGEERFHPSSTSNKSGELVKKDVHDLVPKDAGGVKTEETTVQVKTVSEAQTAYFEESLTQHEALGTKPLPPDVASELQNVDHSHEEKSLLHATEAKQPSDIFHQNTQTHPYTSSAPNETMNQASKKLPGPPGPPPPHHLSSQHPMQPSTSYPSHPPPVSNFPSHQYHMPPEYHSQIMVPTNHGWSNAPPPPPPSHSNIRPSGNYPRPPGGNFHQSHSMEGSHRPYLHQDPLFAREDKFSHLPLPEEVSGLRRNYHSGNQSTSRDFNHPPPYGSQNHANSSLVLNSVPSSSQRYPPSTSEKPLHSSDGVPRMPVPSHYNPFASTFDQPLPVTLGHVNDTRYSKYDSSLISSRAPVNSQDQAVRKPIVANQYDPLFDSIETSSDASKKGDRANESKPADVDADTPASLRKSDDGEEQKGGTNAEHKDDIDEFGEAATDAEVGVVENSSPQPVDNKEWSPQLPADIVNDAVGEIDTDQVQSPGKSKKSKDSRSMKLFKVALADFVKQVLKPSWREGNMSKEAFKTIVRKTVDKVSGAMSRHQIPRSQAKIDHYIESAQRKLTKLVMGYVDKYVKT